MFRDGLLLRIIQSECFFFYGFQKFLCLILYIYFVPELSCLAVEWYDSHLIEQQMSSKSSSPPDHIFPSLSLLNQKCITSISF